MDAVDGGDWEIVRMPALAEEHDPLGREVGESLWPERWSVEELLKIRETGIRAFETQYQGNAVSAEGNLIKAAWFQRFDLRHPPEFKRVICALDTAAKTGVRNDYSVLVKLGITSIGYYVLDVWRARVEFPGLLRRVWNLDDESPAPSAIYVEDSSNAIALIQQLKSESRLPIIPVPAKGSKEARVEGITGTLEAKKVFLPEDAPWLIEFEKELLAFPAGKHDDQVDAFTIALTKAIKRESTWSFAVAKNR
jgi:predicted phage terminase large subunit-like protein